MANAVRPGRPEVELEMAWDNDRCNYNLFVVINITLKINYMTIVDR
jgi:hypothetical protein